MSTLKKIALAASGLVILLAAIPVAVLLLVDPNDYKGELVSLIANKTGRKLELRGPLKLSVLPRIALNVNGVSVGSPAGFGDLPLLAVEQARVGMQLWPLLHHRFAVGPRHRQLGAQRPRERPGERPGVRRLAAGGHHHRGYPAARCRSDLRRCELEIALAH